VDTLLLERGSPFDLDDDDAYRTWRAGKLGVRPRGLQDLLVDIDHPARLDDAERLALSERCRRFNMAVYRCRSATADAADLRRFGVRLGLVRLDANWLADEDGVSRIAVGDRTDGGGRGGFIPYTDRAINWHTDGYYHPDERRIRATILHCVRPARVGGINRLLDPDLVYIALRDASPRWARALMAADAMTIPAREDGSGVARAAQSGPVFSVDPDDGQLHMRYTARTRSIAWKPDEATAGAVDFLSRLLSAGGFLSVRLDAGMGIVSNNVLHDRSAFEDAPDAPRLLYRARYLDRVGGTAWRNG
jgi:alpha-ketoglutarate-dependent taurine dioxygenase